MQISAATLLASQQQVQRAQPPVPQPAFEPMAFKQAARPAAEPGPSVAPAATGTAAPTRNGPVRPGTHIDIKV